MSARLDAVLRVATIADVLRMARVEPPASERKLILCPLPGHMERTPSFNVQKSGKGYRCHGCGGKGWVLALTVALGLATTRSRAVELLCEHYRIPRDAADDAAWKASRREMKRRNTAAAFALPLLQPEPQPSPEDRETLRSALRGCVPLDGTPGVAYLAGRGLCAIAAASNDVRFHPDWLGDGAALVFAVRDRQGRVVAAQGRFIAADASPKTKSKGRIGLGVYATAAALETDVLAICEGPLDALSLAVCELPAIALCGAKNRPAWLRMALRQQHVVLALDRDAAGDAAAADLRVWFNLGTTCERLVLREDTKDVNELLRRDPEELLALARETKFCAYDARNLDEATA